VPMEPYVISEDLGPRAAAFTCRIHGRPTAVINTRAAREPVLYTQAAMALLCCGIDAAHALGALSGVRS
jgi:hypothetical protein